MMKFRLHLDESVLEQKMRDVFKLLVDVEAYEENTKMGFLKSIPSNYGYVFFWYGFLDEDALAKYYEDYFSKEELDEIKEAKKTEEGYFSLEDHVRDRAFPMVYDHPDVIMGGHAEVYVATLFDADLEKIGIDDTIASLRRQTVKLENLKEFCDKFLREIDIEIDYKTIKFVDSKASDEEIGALIFDDEEAFEEYEHIFRRNGWEICLKLEFDGDDVLRDVVKKIDKTISPLKEILDEMVRYETSYFPF